MREDSSTDFLQPSDTFVHRHIGPGESDVREMLGVIGVDSLDQLVDQTVPAGIRLKKPLDLGPARGEHELIAELKKIAGRNTLCRSMIGMGYYDCITPPVIQRNILENPGWYTQYTPYQAEISQGRLEALMNFQTMVADLTGLPLANASLLDEGTAAAEAMHMCAAIAGEDRHLFFVDHLCHPQTISVVKTRAIPLGIEIQVGPADKLTGNEKGLMGVLLQYPDTCGEIRDYAAVVERVHGAGALAVVATDLLALTLIRPPGEFGADIAVGSSQRFGVPLGFGGPHAAFMATKNEYARQLPGRLIGVSKDSAGRPAYRLAIQTREQHIRREKATSNICTAQVLLAIMASMYAVYHGPEGLRRIARRVHGMAALLREKLAALGFCVPDLHFFDTVNVELDQQGSVMGTADAFVKAAADRGINIRQLSEIEFSISVDEKATQRDVQDLVDALQPLAEKSGKASKVSPYKAAPPAKLERTSPFLTHEVFNRFHSETEMLRYMYRLQQRDLSLATSMIPLGSCTMKLNGTSEMVPVTWPEFGGMHPFAPREQSEGYTKLFSDLEKWLAEITGFAAVSLQPNSGAQGEYAGLLAIRGYHESKGNSHRDICLIPTSAHGTNPASAVMAGMRVVPVACDANGNIEVSDLQAKAKEHRDKLAALMITYPSTHGVFEESVRDICAAVHEYGGQVYMDGANMNAQVGLCRPGDIGADVCHLNLHKTFCIPHGGGGPGMGPIAVAKHLAPFLPGHPLGSDQWSVGSGQKEDETKKLKGVGPVSAAPWGSAGILPISWVYIALMGGEGLKRATQAAILNANYMAKRLEKYYPVLYRGKNGRVAHEFILDARPFEKSAGVKVEDIAKRLMDYGFHAPTMSFPVPGTLMIEPTESESKAELDRFCEAMIHIREEIQAIEDGKADRQDNVLKNAPHTVHEIARDDWSHPYTREQAAFPMPWVRAAKFWPAVGRIDNVWGDRNLVCTCPPMEDY